MSEFTREERFIVIKRKHLSEESRTHDSLEQELRVWLDKHLVPTSECVVVESDWPEYETVWSMIEARADGKLNPYQVLEQQIKALRQHKTDYMEAAEVTRKALEAEAQTLRKEVEALRAKVVVVPNGWGIERVHPEDGIGFIIRSPRQHGVGSGTAVWSDSENPAEQLLALMLNEVVHEAS